MRKKLNFKPFPSLKGKPLPSSALEWFDFHFPTSDFDGNIQIAYSGQKGFQHLWTGDRQDIRGFLAEMTVFSKSNYYISANTFTNHQRKLENLFSLENMVIDIDCHQEDISPNQRENLLETFLFRFADLDIPSPHTMVRTGRGLQLWWKILPIHSKCLFFYNQGKSYLLDRIQLLLEEYPEELSSLTLDRVASTNAAGLYRLPGTKNPKAHKEVTYTKTSHNPPYTVQELVKLAEENPVKTTQNSKPKRNSMTEKDLFAGQYATAELDLLDQTNSLTFFRCKQLIQLRKLRNRPMGMEERNNFSLIAYSALRATFPHLEAMEHLRAFNQGFQQPMTEKELQNTIYTAQEKDGYHFTNRCILDFLQVSPQEQELIGLYATKGSFETTTSHPARDIARKLKKEDRIEKIKNYVSQGKTNVEIAKEMNLSEKTVGKYARPFRQERKESILQALKENKTIQSLTEQIKLSTSTLYRYRLSIQ